MGIVFIWKPKNVIGPEEEANGEEEEEGVEEEKKEEEGVVKETIGVNGLILWSNRKFAFINAIKESVISVFRDHCTDTVGPCRENPLP